MAAVCAVVLCISFCFIFPIGHSIPGGIAVAAHNENNKSNIIFQWFFHLTKNHKVNNHCSSSVVFQILSSGTNSKPGTGIIPI